MESPSLDDTINLIKELRDKLLLQSVDADRLFVEAETRVDLVRLELAAVLHVRIEEREITPEEAEPLLQRLGLTDDELEYHRGRQRKKQMRKRSLN